MLDFSVSYGSIPVTASACIFSVWLRRLFECLQSPKVYAVYGVVGSPTVSDFLYKKSELLEAPFRG